MNHSLLRIWIAAIVLAALLSGCAPDEECRKENIIRLKAMLYTQNYNATKQTYTAVAHTPDSLTVWGVGCDSLLYDRARTNNIYLYLDKNAGSSAYVLHYCYSPNDTTAIDVQDTLTINYTNENTYISLECGCFVYQTIQDVQCTHNALDSVEIVNSQVNTIDEEHIYLYY